MMDMLDMNMVNMEGVNWILTEYGGYIFKRYGCVL